MLTRPKELRTSGERLHDRITLSPGETKQARYKAWLAEKTTGPRYCSHHPRTPLVFDPDDSGICPAYEEERRCWDGYPYVDPPALPGVHKFVAFLRCPACRVAYALCPPEFHETKFDTFDASTPERSGAVARCRDFAAQVNAKSCGFMLLVGGPGCGKTRLACNIIRELDDRDALYVRQAQLTLALRATYGRKDVVLHRRPQLDDEEASDDQPPTALEIVQGVRFVVLDEIGCNPLANDERLLLDELIKHRYEQRKPTILISNLPLDQLKQFLGDALTDRIVDATGSRKFLLQFSGESFRRSTGENYLAGLGLIHALALTAAVLATLSLPARLPRSGQGVSSPLRAISARAMAIRNPSQPKRRFHLRPVLPAADGLQTAPQSRTTIASVSHPPLRHMLP